MKYILTSILFFSSFSSLAGWVYDKSETSYYDTTAYFAYLEADNKSLPRIDIRAFSYKNDSLMGLSLAIKGDIGCDIGSICHGFVQFDNNAKQKLTFDILSENGNIIGEIYNDYSFIKKFLNAKKVTIFIPVNSQKMISYDYIPDKIKWDIVHFP
ncbi:TPA: hypothetical protein U2I51_004231 [Providencia rettgeri]|nr:hypothetical protein [Providencia rettgeri]